MRRYADPVEVRSGSLEERTGAERETGPSPEIPQQFLWRGRLWKVRAVVAHWVETGPWWQTTSARAAVGSDEPVHERGPTPLGDLLTERELWRVEAGRGRPELDDGVGTSGVFDLAFDWAEGRWTLVGCTD